VDVREKEEEGNHVHMDNGPLHTPDSGPKIISRRI
jgi:hypothetical protein